MTYMVGGICSENAFVLGQCHTGVKKRSMDTVYGFVSGEDKLEFRDFGGRNFVGAPAFMGNGVEKIVFDKSILSIDADGDAVADVAIELWYVKSLTVDRLLL